MGEGDHEVVEGALGPCAGQPIRLAASSAPSTASRSPSTAIAGEVLRYGAKLLRPWMPQRPFWRVTM